MARLTPKDKRRAALLDRDRADIERAGVNAATRIGSDARIAAMRAFKRGRDPVEAMQREVAKAVTIITDSMVASHLRGHRREAITVAPIFRGAKFKLANTTLDGAIEFLEKLSDLGEFALENLRNMYEGKALQVTHQLSAALEQGILEKIQELVADGAGVQKGVVELGKVFEANGFVPSNSYSLEAIFRTQTQTAYSAGRWTSLSEPEVWDVLWGFRYATVGDSRVRPAHAAMEGITLPKDNPFWSRNFPPNGWGCRCQALETFKPRKEVEPEPIIVDGVTIIPQADENFRFNPGHVFKPAA